MKRTAVLMIMLIIAIPLFAQNSQAYIKEMTGTVEIKAPGSDDWKPAKTGDAVISNTMISTGFKSIAVLSVGNSNIVVRALTRMSLESLMSQDNNEQVNVGLSTGRIRTDVKPPAGGRTTFSVQSPSATASVRGTVFEMSAVSIKVYEGTVGFSSARNPAFRPVMINAGQQTWVDTVSGKVISTAAAADANIAFPPLPGEVDSGGSRWRRFSGGESDANRGTVSVGVNLVPDGE